MAEVFDIVCDVQCEQVSGFSAVYRCGWCSVKKS